MEQFIGAHLKPGHVINFYQPQALGSGLEAKVEAMFWEVDDNVFTEECLHVMVCSRLSTNYNTRRVKRRDNKAWPESPGWHI